MKSKLSLILLTATPIAIVFLIYNSFSNKKVSPPKAAMEIIKCSSTNFLLTEVDTTSQIAPLFDDLGTHGYKVTTSNKLAQKFFNQGLNLTYAFNHAEAHRSFLEAARLDKNMAMAYWGQAYALGPNINDQIPTEERRLKSFEAIQKAKSLSKKSSTTEQHLIDALAHRYSKDSVDIKALRSILYECDEDYSRSTSTGCRNLNFICCSSYEHCSLGLLGY